MQKKVPTPLQLPLAMNNMMKSSFNCLFFTLLICLTGSLTAQTDPIIVKLATENPLLPIALPDFKEKNSRLAPLYLKQLQSVFSFDLARNGSTQVVEAPSKKSFSNALYVIEVTVSEKKLMALLHNTETSVLTKFDAINLSGDLSQDRQLIHQLADAMHKKLFGVNGIASTRILYTVKTKSDDAQPIAEVWEVDYDGANARQITHENALCVTPVYVPAKPGFLPGHFFFISYKLGQPKIFVASLRDGNGQRLSPLKGNQLMPAIAAQRDKVAFISDVSGNPDLFLTEFSPETGISQKPRQIFATKQSTQGTPSFSPDGKRLAFVSNKDGKPRVYVMEIPAPGVKLNEIKATLITKQNRESSAPSWSPDGKKIAYTAMTDSVRQIWVYDFETNQDRQLTTGGGHKENPTWAPNSLHLAFNAVTGKTQELFILNLNQTDTVKITSGPGKKRFPNWQP